VWQEEQKTIVTGVRGISILPLKMHIAYTTVQVNLTTSVVGYTVDTELFT